MTGFAGSLVARHSNPAAITSAKTSTKGRREAVRVGHVTFFGPAGKKEFDFLDAGPGARVSRLDCHRSATRC